MNLREACATAAANFGKESFTAKIKEEDPLMVKYLPLLQKINRAGFLTVNSQAGHRSKGKHYQTGKLYELVERAYLVGFMLEEDAAKFIKAMGIQTDKNAIFLPIGASVEEIPSALDIPLTIVKSGSSTTVETHVAAAVPKEMSDSFKKMVQLNKSEKAVYILCWETHWGSSAAGRKGLFTQVLDCLR